MTARKSISRPINHLEALSRDYPGLWRDVDMVRGSRGQLVPDWPEWCFMPIAGWLAIASQGQQPGLGELIGASRMAALGPWRYSQGIYRFDKDVLASIAETVPNGEMPTEVLYRLPEWSVYIETPGLFWMGSVLHGFWAHLEFDVNTQRHELRLLLDTEDVLIGVPMHLGPWTVTEALDRAYSEAHKHRGKMDLPESLLNNDLVAERVASELYGVVSLLLYICSDEPEIDDEREPGAYPARPRPTRTKKGWRLFPAKRPRVWMVGESLGAKLRSGTGEGEATGRKVSTHLRRAHWHGFWKGPRDGERQFIYKWLPPIAVGSTPPK